MVSKANQVDQDLLERLADEKLAVSGGEAMLQSINNLRLNVNSHIIGGSKNVMGRMRKLSINELNRHSSSSRKYRIAFYVILTSLSLLFLYLIYQNLFNDR